MAMKFSQLLLPAIFLLAGCGGNGSDSQGTVNLYTGTWTGPWSAGSDTGTASFHFTGLNSVSGTIVDTTTGQTYQVTGSISQPNLHTTDIHLTESNSNISAEFNGTIVENSNFSSFSGTLTEVGNGLTQTITLTYQQSQ